jgi:hypothetical protein
MRDLCPLTEILIMGNMNNRPGNKQVNLPESWDPTVKQKRWTMICTIVDPVRINVEI